MWLAVWGGGLALEEVGPSNSVSEKGIRAGPALFSDVDHNLIVMTIESSQYYEMEVHHEEEYLKAYFISCHVNHSYSRAAALYCEIYRCL